MRFLLVLAAFAAIFSTSVFGQKMDPDDVLSNHLDSIGSSADRKAVKNQIVVGNAKVTFVQRKFSAEGRVVIASEGPKFFLGARFNANDYPSETFVYDGKDANAAFVVPGTRSVLGNFLQTNKSLLKESLLGGVLSTSWAAFSGSSDVAKLNWEGVKKINGKETYAIGYSPRGGSDVSITLYFDKATFHHVRTEYKRTSSAGIGLRPEQSSGFSETRLSLTEDFDDFKVENKLTLPHKYVVYYSISGQNGTTEIRWDFDINEFAVNQRLDASTFTYKEQ